MKTYLGNAFSLNMVAGDAMLSVRQAAATDIPADAVSCIGHEATATVVGQMLGREVKANRIAVSLEKGDKLYACTLFRDGKPYRAPEGAILGEADLAELTIEFRAVEVL